MNEETDKQETTTTEPPAEGVAPSTPAGGEGGTDTTTETPPKGESEKLSTEGPDTPSGLMHGDEKPADDAGVLGAPEGDYAFEAPEGVELDANMVKDFGEVAKELNLSQEAAQKVVAKMTPSINKSLQARLEAASKTWAEASRSDAEFGGDKFKENLKDINRAYGEWATPELQKLLAESGLNNHPEMLRLFYKISKATGEGRFVRGGSSRGTPEDDGRKFYGY